MAPPKKSASSFDMTGAARLTARAHFHEYLSLGKVAERELSS